jgi:dGTPase
MLNELAADIGGFEGNAQSFRLLTRLEPKAFSPADGPRPNATIGLNLTRAALDAASKYPWARRVGTTKFGVYDDDVDVFTWVRNGRTDEATSFEAQVMDWSDDVSYCVHDIEDGIYGGHLDVNILTSAVGRQEVIEIAQKWYGSHFEAEGLNDALQRLGELPSWPATYNGAMQSMAKLKNLTSTLVGRFCVAAQAATRERFGHQPHSRYSAQLVVPSEARYEVTALKALSARFVMNREGVDDLYVHQRQLIADLVGVLNTDPEQYLDAFHKALWLDAATPQAAARVVIDHVASLTDVSIGHWHATLCQ